MKKLQIYACIFVASVAIFSGDCKVWAATSPATPTQHKHIDPAGPLALASGIMGGAQSGLPGQPPSSSSASATGAASGGSPDPCSSILPDHSSIIVEPDPLGVAPGGGADPLTAPTMNVRAQNPAIKKCEGGRILVRVESKRFYGFHLGDEVPISIQIVADDGVQLNFESLSQEILGFDGSDFQLVPSRPISIASHPYAGRPHSTLYGIELAVQSFVTEPTLVFNLDLKYAVDVPPGVKQPNWRTLTTPDFVVTNTPVVTTPNDDELDDGALHGAEARSSWVSLPLTVAGLFLMVWFGFMRRLIARLNKMRPGRVVPPEEKAWTVINKVFSDARDYGEFGAPYLRNIEATLRAYLAQTSLMRIESLSIKEISKLMQDDPRLPAIVSVLKKCESVIYARVDQPVRLTDVQIRELYDELQVLVPEPEL